jgi:hypothetical protein
MKEDEMSGVCSTYGEKKEKLKKNFSRKIRRERTAWENSIQTGYEGVDGISRPQCRKELWAGVDTVIYFGVTMNFLRTNESLNNF